METGNEPEHVELPRAKLGGLKKGPVEDLLRRIARDYANLQRENRELREALERLETEAAEAVPQGVPGSSPAETTQRSSQETEELVAAVLAIAQKAAREMREAARSECELMIRKTRSHVLKLEREKASAAAELEELQAVRREMRQSMRASLQALLRTFVAERAGETTGWDWGVDDPAVVFAADEHEPKRKSKKKRSKS